MLLAFLLQASVIGTPLPTVPIQTAEEPISISVRNVRRVGDDIVVEYDTDMDQAEKPPISIEAPKLVTPAGKVISPKNAPVVKSDGSRVGQTVSFQIDGTVLDNAVYGTPAPIFNESTWFFVVGQNRIPFRF